MKHRSLDKVLTKRQRDTGLYLNEPDGHLLELKYGDEVVAVFSQLGATVQSIRETAHEWLKKKSNQTARRAQ